MNKKTIITVRIIFCLFLITTVALSTSCKKNKHKHQWEDATCLTAKKCKTCGEIEGTALGHQKGAFKVVTNATCISEGLEQARCTRCNELLEENAIAKSDHDLQHHEALDATCTTAGHTAYDTCKNCDYTTYQEIAKLDHDLEHHEALDATCTTAGHTAYDTCKNCDYTTYQEIAMTSHTWIAATTETPKTCSKCGITEGKPLQPFTYNLRSDYTFFGERTRINITNYTTLENFSITYSNDNIIKIDEFGVIRSIGIGKTEVTITLNSNPNRYLTFEFEVLPERPVASANFTKMKIGDLATIFFENSDYILEEFDVSFTHEHIFELTDLKQLKAIGIGDETITLTSKNDSRVSTELYVSVVDDKNLLIYSENEYGIMESHAQMKMFNNQNVSNVNLTWGTTDKNVAIVSEKGIVTAISEGYVTVYAKDEKTKQVVNYNIRVEGIANVDYISRFIHLALDENGIHETDPTGSYNSSDNYQKYGAWYPNNGQPWCAMFVSWCWHFSGLSTDLLCKYQGCTAGMKWCTEQGIMHYVQDYDFGKLEMLNGASPKQYGSFYQPKSGDIVFFLSSGMGHTGIVIYSDAEYLYTIEGNTSDQVAIKRWSLNDARITGYASPKYPDYIGEREDFSWIAKQKDDGTYWWKAVSLVEKVD